MSDKVKIILAGVLAILIAVFLVFISLIKYNILGNNEPIKNPNSNETNNDAIQTKNVTCTIEETSKDINTKDNIVFTFQNNVLYRSNQNKIITLNNNNNTDVLMQEYKALSFNGYNRNTNVNDNIITIATYIDYTQLNENDLISNNVVLDFSKNSTENNIINNIENRGYTCK